jgi:cytochrome c-type biogenesis protein
MSAKTKRDSGTSLHASEGTSGSVEVVPNTGSKLATILSFLLPAITVVGLLYLLAAMRSGAESAMAGLSALLPVGYAFSAGMVASVNPCGFLLLPSYILYHLGSSDEEWAKHSTTSRAIKGLYLGAAATAGFVAIFALMGGLVAAGGQWLNSVFPYGRLVIGVGMAGLGGWLLLTGKSLGLAAASRMTLTPRRNIGNVFAFGIVYAISSLSCTLPIFLVVVGSALVSESWMEVLGQFVSYALGMGLVFVAVTVGAAFLRQAVTPKLRGMVLYVKRFSALLLVGVGGYLIYDWIATVARI